MDGMPEPPRRAPDDTSQGVEATLDHLLHLEKAAHERGDLHREDQLRGIVESYQSRAEAGPDRH
jgi:hypothetical protein